jgi:hypothetical protein
MMSRDEFLSEWPIDRFDEPTPGEVQSKLMAFRLADWLDRMRYSDVPSDRDELITVPTETSWRAWADPKA